ncbi:hypothetical protein HNY73_019708 [Argiope bruennichi]|uniref:Uncharacterized protein n=1 Tax=Argiope bruennichi TaxID=94029 RepID=A0A8T0E583_ARGBR|nr:hypothetical protein HNY73_019708 [Argiope bruennichi]
MSWDAHSSLARYSRLLLAYGDESRRLNRRSLCRPHPSDRASATAPLRLVLDVLPDIAHGAGGVVRVLHQHRPHERQCGSSVFARTTAPGSSLAPAAL